MQADLGAYFQKHSKVTVNGEPAIDMTTLVEHDAAVKHWKTFVPVSMSTKFDGLREAMNASAIRRGQSSLDDEERTIAQSATMPKRLRGPPIKVAYTLPEVTAFLWDSLAQRLQISWLVEIGRPAYDVAKDRLGKMFSACATGRFQLEHRWPANDAQWQTAAKLILSGCSTLDMEALRITSIDDCVSDIELICARECSVNINRDLARQLIAPICMNIVEGSHFLAKTICRMDLMNEILGETLSMHVRSHVRRLDFGLGEGSLPDTTATLNTLLQELTDTRQKLTMVKDMARRSDVAAITDLCGQSKMMPRQKPKIVELMRLFGQRNITKNS